MKPEVQDSWVNGDVMSRDLEHGMGHELGGLARRDMSGRAEQ